MKSILEFFFVHIVPPLNGFPTVTQTAFVRLFVDFVIALLRGCEHCLCGSPRKHYNLCFSLEKVAGNDFFGVMWTYTYTIYTLARVSFY